MIDNTYDNLITSHAALASANVAKYESEKQFLEACRVDDKESMRFLPATISQSIRDIKSAERVLITAKEKYNKRPRDSFNREIFLEFLSHLDSDEITKEGNSFWGKYEIGHAIDKLLEKYLVSRK